MRYSVFVLACVIVGAAECEYPEIGVLSAADVLYRQLQDDIQRYHQRGAAREEGSPQLLIYRYRKRHGDTIGIIASQTNLTVCTIATINRLGTFEDFNDLSYVLLPNQPGAYIPVDRKSILEEMMYSRRTAATVPGRQIVIQDRPKPSSFLFFPGENFNAVENAYFLKTLFRYPLARVEITSWFGERSNPLTGRREWHKGIDLRAREGTEVRAAAAGIVFDSFSVLTLTVSPSQVRKAGRPHAGHSCCSWRQND